VGDVLDGWSDPAAVRRKLDLWWKRCKRDRRRAVLDHAGSTLPEWLAQDLIRAGLPFQVNPGITDKSLLGQFVTPPLVVSFLDEKRVQPTRRWWQFWRK